MGQTMELRLRQHLTLTPQLQQALRLLQLSALEFEQEMREALDTNPFLEEDDEAARSTPSAPSDEGQAAEAAPEPPAEPAPGRALGQRRTRRSPARRRFGGGRRYRLDGMVRGAAHAPAIICAGSSCSRRWANAIVHSRIW